MCVVWISAGQKHHVARDTASLQNVREGFGSRLVVDRIEEGLFVVLVNPVGEEQIALDQAGQTVVAPCVLLVEWKDVINHVKWNCFHDKLLFSTY